MSTASGYPWPLNIRAAALYAPPRVETSADIAPRLGVEPAWIDRATGVLRRHISDEPMEVLAARAARLALDGGGPPDLILNASATPRQLIPDSAAFIARELGYSAIPAFSIHATCVSFIVAMHSAAAFLQGGAFRRILIVSSEISSTSRRWSEPESAALLGDGAAAVVVEHPGSIDGPALLAYRMGTWPEGVELAQFAGGGVRHHPNAADTLPEHNEFTMQGPRLYKLAIRRVAPLVAGILEDVGFTPADIDVVVPHQMSGPGIAALTRCGFATDRIVNIIGEYGNCIAASVPMALATAMADGRIRPGNRVMLVGTGAGLSVAAAILRV